MNELWAILVIYRFHPYAPRLKNYRLTVENLRRQKVKILTIEIVSKNLSFDLKPEDADILIQLKTKSILWHKERAINIAVEKLPKEAKYVAWIDADIIIQDNNWPQKTIDLLKKHSAVQLMSRIRYMGKNTNWTHELPCFVYNRTKNNTWGLPGLAWAAKRDLFEQIGLYEYHIVGGNDDFFAEALWKPGGPPKDQTESFALAAHKSYYDFWLKKIQKYVGISRLGYLNTLAMHLWHDDKKYRLYSERKAILANFNPTSDTTLEAQTGLLYVTNPQLRTAIEAYFWFREQDKTPLVDYLFEIYQTHLKKLSSLNPIPSKHSRTFKTNQKKHSLRGTSNLRQQRLRGIYKR